MLGWLILFTFLTGAFVGSTALLGAMILLSKSEDQRAMEERIDHEQLEREPKYDGPILDYANV